jgi:Cysteine rich repeat
VTACTHMLALAALSRLEQPSTCDHLHDDHAASPRAQDNFEKLESEECKDEVFYFIKMEVSDFRNDVMLAEACKPDVDSHCADVEPGEGRVIECLRMHRCASLARARSARGLMWQAVLQAATYRPPYFVPDTS